MTMTAASPTESGLRGFLCRHALIAYFLRGAGLARVRPAATASANSDRSPERWCSVCYGPAGTTPNT